jgi:hypothetical protein
MTGQPNDAYTVRQATYDLRKLRGKQLVVKPGRTRRCHVPAYAARTIAGLTVLRDRVGSILAGIRTPDGDPSRPPRPGSTMTTKPSASTCKPCSTTSASPHRQLLVDRVFVSA